MERRCTCHAVKFACPRQVILKHDFISLDNPTHFRELIEKQNNSATSDVRELGRYLKAIPFIRSAAQAVQKGLRCH